MEKLKLKIGKLYRVKRRLDVGMKIPDNDYYVRPPFFWIKRGTILMFIRSPGAVILTHDQNSITKIPVLIFLYENRLISPIWGVTPPCLEKYFEEEKT